ncbi:MAG: tetratricopeptide repeat protein [Gemmatimonadaceae bacterium]
MTRWVVASGFFDRVRENDAPRVLRALAFWCVVSWLCLPRVAARAQSNDTTAFYKALELESAGKYRDAAPLFRSALSTTSAVSALLGLERVYAELGWSDSLLAPLDTLIKRNPHESVYRSVQLRTLQSLGKEERLRAAIDQWVKDVPGDPSPYREYARLLLQRGLTASADSVIRQARQALGSANDLQLEIAQLRAAMGLWEQSAQAWRLALASSPYLEQAAVYALAPTPLATRTTVRQVLLAPPIDVASRRALAGLEMGWGSPADGWLVLRELPPDSLSAAAWTDFATRAEGEERWPLARDALVAALHWRRTPETTLRAANAAVRAGDPGTALMLLPLEGPGAAITDSARAARTTVPLQARALAMVGRPAAAQRLVERFDRWLTPGTRTALTRAVALGWVRAGDMGKARASLSSAGAEGDSSDAAGWLALYEGNLRTARVLLRTSTETTPELATALAIVARIHADSAPSLGRAFLMLARNDTSGAAAAFVEAADRQGSGEATSILLATAAQLRSALRDDTQAIALWKRIVEQQSSTPEAPSAELEWARALRRHGDSAGAVARLEHLILTYPQSALVPQARRELDLARAGIPGAT